MIFIEGLRAFTEIHGLLKLSQIESFLIFHGKNRKNHLEFNFWIQIHIGLTSLGSFKSVAHVKEQSE